MHENLYIAAAAFCSAAFLLLAGTLITRRGPHLGGPFPLVVTALGVSLLGTGASLAALANGGDPVPLRRIALGGALSSAAGITAILVRAQRSPHKPQRTLTGYLAAVVVLLIGTSSFALVSHGATRVLPSFASHSFIVYATCANKACGLNQHTKPSVAAPTRGGMIADGEPIELLCQRTGEPAHTRQNHTSRQWDLMPNGLWVSDLFVSTSKTGYVSSDLPRCPVSIG